MRELAFVGLSDDGTSLVLSSTDGTRYVVPCDERLEAAVRRDRSRLGQLEIALDGTTPRDIQQRVRHGQRPTTSPRAPASPSSASCASPAPCSPSASTWPLRRARWSCATAAAAPRRGDGRRGADPRRCRRRLLEWDAWRREDGRWSLLASWDPVDDVAVGATAALWVYDPAGRTVVADDPASAWLLGEQPTVAIVEETDGRPLLVGLPSAADVDAWDDDFDDPDAAMTAIVDRDSGAQVVELMDRPPAEPDDASPLDDLYDTLPGLARPESGRASRRANRKAARETPAADGDVAKGSKPRAQVPSWDEILFGTRNPET